MWMPARLLFGTILLASGCCRICHDSCGLADLVWTCSCKCTGTNIVWRGYDNESGTSIVAPLRRQNGTIQRGCQHYAGKEASTTPGSNLAVFNCSVGLTAQVDINPRFTLSLRRLTTKARAYSRISAARCHTVLHSGMYTSSPHFSFPWCWHFQGSMEQGLIFQFLGDDVYTNADWRARTPRLPIGAIHSC